MNWILKHPENVPFDVNLTHFASIFGLFGLGNYVR